MTVVQYRGLMANSKPFGEHMRFNDEYALFDPDQIVTGFFIGNAMIFTFLYVAGMAILGSIWFALKPTPDVDFDDT